MVPSHSCFIYFSSHMHGPGFSILFELGVKLDYSLWPLPTNISFITFLGQIKIGGDFDLYGMSNHNMSMAWQPCMHLCNLSAWRELMGKDNFLEGGECIDDTCDMEGKTSWMLVFIGQILYTINTYIFVYKI